MIYLLDSNTCIEWLRQRAPNVVARIRREPTTNIALCSVVLAELVYGSERSGVAYRAGNLKLVEQLRQRFFSLPLDDPAGILAGRLQANFASLGMPIGPNDLLITSPPTQQPIMQQTFGG